MQIRMKALSACVWAGALTGALHGQTKFTVSPEDQPADTAPAATMTAFGAMNARLASAVDEPASSCLKSYALYQACKGGDAASTCGTAPACRVKAQLPAMDLTGMELFFTSGQEAASLAPRVTSMNGNIQNVKIMNAAPEPNEPVKIIRSDPSTGGVAGSAPAAARPNGPARISGGVIQGLRTNFVQPKYPDLAKAAHLSGTVVLQAILSKDGFVERLGVMSATNPVFDNAAIDAVRQWHYKPFLLNGQPTELITTITVNFALSPPKPSTVPNGSMARPDEHIPSMPH